ncbi:hypothetical protein [Mangrovibacter phragmitis]|uniref:hypothetical protein n=1 Tax=Mangrovibacter phragmitis TaxID=1691903 RepID=UPI0035184B17
MKLTPTIEQIALSIESWAQDVGWKTVGVRFADEYHRQGGGSLIPVASDEKGIKNATQRVKRIFGLGGPRYLRMACMLESVALAAMPKRRRVELESPRSPELATARAMEAFSSAMSSITIRCPTATEKLVKAMDTLQALVPIIEQAILVT